MNKARWTVAMVVWAAVALGGAPQVKMAGNTDVVPGPAFPATAACEVRNVKFYSCAIVETGAPCTVVAGQFVLNLPNDKCSVDIEIALFDTVPREDRFKQIATFKHHINLPQKGIPVYFTCLGAASEKKQGRGDANCYAVSFRFGKPDPLH